MFNYRTINLTEKVRTLLHIIPWRYHRIEIIYHKQEIVNMNHVQIPLVPYIHLHVFFDNS